jgi:hypothetical protein
MKEDLNSVITRGCRAVMGRRVYSLGLLCQHRQGAFSAMSTRLDTKAFRREMPCQFHLRGERGRDMGVACVGQRLGRGERVWHFVLG